MKRILGKALSFFYSFVDGCSEAASAGSSILVSTVDSSANLTPANYIGPYAFGILTGIITFVTSYSFQGAEIRKRFSDTDEEEEIEYDPIDEISRRRKSAYIFLKYSYIASAFVVDLLDVCLLYSASKAWIQDFKEDEDTPLTFISHTEGSLILLYYCLLDLPFILTTEVTQTCSQIRESFKISPEEAPDHLLIEKIKRLIRPLAINNFRREVIRVSGSVADTIEHVTPLMLIIPPSWILRLSAEPAIISGGVLTAAALMVIGVTGTILTQTYLFEGWFSKKNLIETTIDDGDDSYEEEEPWVNSTFSKAFHKLLYLGGPLHGIDIGLSILLTLRELEAPEALVYIASFSAFFIGWMGNHYSEVMESQENLKKITKDASQELALTEMISNGHRSPVFGRTDYGTYETSDFQKIPALISGYKI